MVFYFLIRFKINYTHFCYICYSMIFLNKELEFLILLLNVSFFFGVFFYYLMFMIIIKNLNNNSIINIIIQNNLFNWELNCNSYFLGMSILHKLQVGVTNIISTYSNFRIFSTMMIFYYKIFH